MEFSKRARDAAVAMLRWCGIARSALRAWCVSADGPVAQLVEHRTFNAVVAGSSPARLTMIRKRFISPLPFPVVTAFHCKCAPSFTAFSRNRRALRPLAVYLRSLVQRWNEKQD